jgi:DNA-binding HxlR family transcriptional regulator
MEVSMRPKRFDAKSGCAVGVTLSVIGGMWKPLILFHLFAGKKRFMELSRAIPNATQRILTLQLRELEADGVIVRHAYPQIPPKVEYEISAFGQSLGPVLLRFGVGASNMEVQLKASLSHTTPLKIVSQTHAPCNVG